MITFLNNKIKSFASISNVIKSRTPYTPLSYIESTGTQYINTGCNVKNNTSIEFSYYPLKAGWDIKYLYVNDDYFVGTRDKNATTLWWAYNGWNNIGMYVPISKPLTKVNITANGEIRYDNISKISGRGQSPNIDSPILFGYNAPMRIGEIKIYENDLLITHLKPVLHHGNVCMYDTIKNTYLYNAGTGNFGAGEVVS